MIPSLSNALNGATVVVTGGAGFIGAHVAAALAREAPGARVVAIDNLRRRGSELHLSGLADAGVEFVHGDVRNADDLALPGRDIAWLIECSAEPSVLAGRTNSPHYVIQTNLNGTVNCLELARRHQARVIFLSTSRVYAIAALNRIAVVDAGTRVAIAPEQTEPGVSPAGVRAEFSTTGARSLYGATKLASELLLQEYGDAYGVPFVINRCGVVAGPGQMGTEEQGVFTYWMARHHFGGELAYRGWGGHGTQVRDLLHVEDLWQLLRRQIERWDVVQGHTYNAGGGPAVSLSLQETTALCHDITGRRLTVHQEPGTHAADVRTYVTDNAAVSRDTGWAPARDAATVLRDIHGWMAANETALAPIFRAPVRS